MWTVFGNPTSPHEAQFQEPEWLREDADVRSAKKQAEWFAYEFRVATEDLIPQLFRLYSAFFGKIHFCTVQQENFIAQLYLLLKQRFKGCLSRAAVHASLLPDVTPPDIQAPWTDLVRKTLAHGRGKWSPVTLNISPEFSPLLQPQTPLVSLPEQPEQHRGKGLLIPHQQNVQVGAEDGDENEDIVVILQEEGTKNQPKKTHVATPLRIPIQPTRNLRSSPRRCTGLVYGNAPMPPGSIIYDFPRSLVQRSCGRTSVHLLPPEEIGSVNNELGTLVVVKQSTKSISESTKLGKLSKLSKSAKSAKSAKQKSNVGGRAKHESKQVKQEKQEKQEAKEETTNFNPAPKTQTSIQAPLFSFKLDAQDMQSPLKLQLELQRKRELVSIMKEAGNVTALPGEIQRFCKGCTERSSACSVILKKVHIDILELLNLPEGTRKFQADPNKPDLESKFPCSITYGELVRFRRFYTLFAFWKLTFPVYGCYTLVAWNAFKEKPFKSYQRRFGAASALMLKVLRTWEASGQEQGWSRVWEELSKESSQAQVSLVLNVGRAIGKCRKALQQISFVLEDEVGEKGSEFFLSEMVRCMKGLEEYFLSADAKLLVTAFPDLERELPLTFRNIALCFHEGVDPLVSPDPVDASKSLPTKAAATFERLCKSGGKGSRKLRFIFLGEALALLLTNDQVADKIGVYEVKAWTERMMSGKSA